MESITLTKTDMGIVVGGKTFDIKTALRDAGARWNKDTSTWIFRDADDIQHLTKTVRDAVRRKADEAKASAAEAKAWLKTDEAKALLKAKIRTQIAACVGQPGFHWICCKECVIIDEKRRHTACNACAVDGNSFFVNGRLRTGD